MKVRSEIHNQAGSRTRRAAIVQVFIPALQHLATSAQQLLSPLPSNPAAIRIYWFKTLPLLFLFF